MSINQSITTHQSINQSINQSIDPPTHLVIKHIEDESSDSLPPGHSPRILGVSSVPFKHHSVRHTGGLHNEEDVD